MAATLLRISVIYLVLGGCLGLYMGTTMDFTFKSVHAHILLAGWLSLAVMGLVYRAFPRSTATRLAKAHVWLHNLGLPLLLTGLAFAVSGHYSQAVMLVAMIGAISFLAGLVLFAINVWRTVGPGEWER